VKHVECMGEIDTRFRSENLKGRYHLGNLDVDGKITLEWFLGKQGGKTWTGFIWLRTGTSGGIL